MTNERFTEITDQMSALSDEAKNQLHFEQMATYEKAIECVNAVYFGSGHESDRDSEKDSIIAGLTHMKADITRNIEEESLPALSEIKKGSLGAVDKCIDIVEQAYSRQRELEKLHKEGDDREYTTEANELKSHEELPFDRNKANQELLKEVKGYQNYKPVDYDALDNRKLESKPDKLAADRAKQAMADVSQKKDKDDGYGKD